VSPDIWTIGHSTRSFEELADMLQSFTIKILVDVRRYPHSRRHPHFNTDELRKGLFHRKIRYEYLGDELGGFRKKSKTSPHVGITNDSFRGYADHMETPLFLRGVEKLLAMAAGQRTAYMCSESNYKSCHRRMISDYLTMIRGYTVHHIVRNAKEIPHVCIPEARPVDGRLLYAARPLEEFGSPGEHVK
jgi:uncharacterized protein (DUF488 family)